VIRSGNPADTDPWGRSCGFHPGSHPREHQRGTAATFDQARAAFEVAWRVFLSRRTEWIFRNGEISAIGLRKNIGASIAASACRMIGAMVPDRGWKRPFDDPIPLPDGGELRTPLDAARYVDALPRSMHEREEWQTVMEVLRSAVEGRELVSLLRIAVTLALQESGPTRGPRR
jgi:hypothetical protein